MAGEACLRLTAKGPKLEQEDRKDKLHGGPQCILVHKARDGDGGDGGYLVVDWTPKQLQQRAKYKMNHPQHTHAAMSLHPATPS